MKNKPKIYLISASLRSMSDHETLIEGVKNLANETELYEYVEKIAREKKISNSECALIASAFGALKFGADLKYIRLNRYFLKDGSVKNAGELLSDIKNADGFVFSMPVYFGDRSSLFHDFLRICEEEKHDFFGKSVGFVSVGAKRNGGQETTNIYAIHNMTELGALVVGNGPPTSQYGGTCVGGEMGTMENDYFGIMTSIGVGLKVCQTAAVLNEGMKGEKKPVIDFWILEDENSQVKKYIEDLIGGLNKKKINADFKILDLTKNKFHRCFACSICPFEKDSKIEYKCINKNDDMIRLHSRLVSSDAIVVAGLSLEDVFKKETVYQRFIERTRYIRRDNFLLTNKLVMALSLNELSANSLFNLRVLTSFIRHNTIFHKGFEEYIDKNRNIVYNRKKELEDIMESFARFSGTIKSGREKVDLGENNYKEIGY